jgi:hypothetical protein
MSPIGFRSVIAGIMAASALLTNPLQAQAPAVELEANYRRPPVRAIENPLVAELGGTPRQDPRSSPSAETACLLSHLPEIELIETRLRTISAHGDRHDHGGPQAAAGAR